MQVSQAGGGGQAGLVALALCPALRPSRPSRAGHGSPEAGRDKSPLERGEQLRGRGFLLAMQRTLDFNS